MRYPLALVEVALVGASRELDPSLQAVRCLHAPTGAAHIHARRP